MKKVISFFAGLLLFSHISIAAEGGWMSGAKPISEIIVEGNDNGQALIVLGDGGVADEYIPSGCKGSPYNIVVLHTDKGKGMYSLLLSAYLASKPVRFAVGCSGSRPLITNVRF